MRKNTWIQREAAGIASPREALLECPICGSKEFHQRQVTRRDSKRVDYGVLGVFALFRDVSRLAAVPNPDDAIIRMSGHRA